MRRFSALLALGIVIAGCAGSGGSGNVIPLSTTEAQYQQGWTWAYNFTGTFTPYGGSAQSATGTYTITCSNRTGNQVTEAHSMSVVANGSTHTYSGQFVY